MSENAKNPAAQNTIEDPPEYNAENARNPQTGEFQKPSNAENAKNSKEGSDWLGGPQNGAQIPADGVKDPPKSPQTGR